MPDWAEYQLEMVLHKLPMSSFAHHHAKAFVTKPLAVKQQCLDYSFILEFSAFPKEWKSEATLPYVLGMLQKNDKIC